MVEQTNQDRINCRIKLKICSTIFLHPKERWITMIGTRLQKIEPIHNKG